MRLRVIESITFIIIGFSIAMKMHLNFLYQASIAFDKGYEYMLNNQIFSSVRDQVGCQFTIDTVLKWFSFGERLICKLDDVAIASA